MSNEKQSIIPTSGPLPIDAAAYAIGRNHKGMPPEKLGVPKGKLGLGRRGADQPKESPKYTTYEG